MDKKVIAGSVVSLADQVPSTAQSSVIAGQPSSAVSQASSTLDSSQPTGNYQAKGLARLEMVLVGLGLGFIGWK